MAIVGPMSLHQGNAHYGSYYTLLLIPVGLLVFVLIKLLSESVYSSKPIVINTGDYPEHDGTKPLEMVLQERMRRRQELNDRTFIVRGLPLLLSELLPPFGFTLGEPAKSSDNLTAYTAMLCNYYGLGIVHDGMVWRGSADSCISAFRARMVYEDFIKSGNPKINASCSINELARIGARRRALGSAALK
jgi:hypothetical protein